MLALYSAGGASSSARTPPFSDDRRRAHEPPPRPPSSYETRTAADPSRRTNEEADAGTARRSSSLVDGEKRLKSALRVLEARQQRGVDVGVKHATRWEGEDVPVWEPSNGDRYQDLVPKPRPPPQQHQQDEHGVLHDSNEEHDANDESHKNLQQQQQQSTEEIDDVLKRIAKFHRESDEHSAEDSNVHEHRTSNEEPQHSNEEPVLESLRNTSNDPSNDGLKKKPIDESTDDDPSHQNSPTQHVRQTNKISNNEPNKKRPVASSNEESNNGESDEANVLASNETLLHHESVDNKTMEVFHPKLLTKDGDESAEDVADVHVEETKEEDTHSESNKVSNEGISTKTRTKNSATSRTDVPAPLDVFPEAATVVLQPVFGEHRPDQDAVFAMAEGYDVNIYLAFLVSLRRTGFAGDVVLSVSSLDRAKPDVEEFLRAQPNLVVYAVEWACGTNKRDGGVDRDAKEGRGACRPVGLYADAATGTVLDDLRTPRPVATARYELYWIWATRYDPHRMIMLVDSRDTYFQSNPFSLIERSDVDEKGLLHLFEENNEEFNLRTSTFNSRWIKHAYGEDGEAVLDNTILCSGSTMGERDALDVYLRRMVAEFDRTNCRLMGCDQGFHNYLYYSGALAGLNTRVHPQGRGAINNLGALRKTPLSKRNILDDEKRVLNYDGSVSPVAHQFDRDDELRQIVNQRKKEFLSDWKKERNVLRNKEYESLRDVSPVDAKAARRA